jgi:hypothetical protein
MSRALLEAGSSAFRPPREKKRSSNDAGLPDSDPTAPAESRQSFGGFGHGRAHDASV